ncbi:hypothetical protein DQX05_01490 [Paenibacillus thiaminolyticus]|uniref:Uncharacterized protein n=1 Tax=Paenibacillus thiaminolyticus TaxID=49283 RepID=A0A3A3GQR1_PANTH|nr:hypothetical protein DQX05_01490 [Paenibacillus thiaminolyticus]
MLLSTLKKIHREIYIISLILSVCVGVYSLPIFILCLIISPKKYDYYVFLAISLFYILGNYFDFFSATDKKNTVIGILTVVLYVSITKYRNRKK